MKTKMLITLSVLAAGAIAASASSLTDLGPSTPAGLANPSGNGTMKIHIVEVTRDGTVAAGTDSSGNAYIWTASSGKVNIGAGYTVVAVRSWPAANTTLLVVANKWGDTITHPWVWTGNADGSNGSWVKLPGGANATSSAGFWFATGCGVTNGNGNWWVSGYTTNTTYNGASPGHKQGVAYQYAATGYGHANYAQICNFSSTTNWNANGKSGHLEEGFYGCSDTGWMVGTEGYGGDGLPGSGSVHGCYIMAWSDVGDKPRPNWFGPPESSGRPTTSYVSATACISSDGTIKAGTDKNAPIYWGLWWDNASLIPNVNKLPQLNIGGATPSDWEEVHALNGDGTVMGGEYYRTDQSDHWFEAMVYFRTSGQIYTVGDLLGMYGLETNGWVFNDVTAFNDNGNVLSGWGTNSTDNVAHGWVAQLLTVSFQTVNPNCNPGGDGSITVTASGVGTIQISADGGTTWVSGASPFANTFSGLSAGTYNIRVKDSFGYVAKFPITIGPAVIVSAVGHNVNCNGGSDGSITVTATGDTANLVFSDDGGNTFTAPTTSPHTFSGLTPGNYIVVVGDGLGCYATNTVTITQPALALTISAVVTNNVTCNGAAHGSIEVIVTGGTPAFIANTYQFSDDGGTTWVSWTSPYTCSGLAAGNYPIEVKDANGCIVLWGTVPITQPPSIVVSPVTWQSPSCNGGSDGSITVTASGGTGAFFFSDNNGASYTSGTSPFTFTGLAAGSYSIWVKDANSCSNSYSLNPVVLTNPRALVIANQPANQTVPVGGTATFTVVAGSCQPLFYFWESVINGVTNFVDSGVTVGSTNTLTLANVQPNQAGAYFVTITNVGYSTNSSLAALTVTCAISTSSTPPLGGTTSGDGTYPCGTNITMNATPNACYNFVNWTEGTNVVSSSLSYTFTAVTNRILVANFAPLGPYTISASVSPLQAGTTSGGGTVTCGSNVTVCATANACYSFVNWTEDTNVVSTTNCYTFTAASNRTLVANFALLGPYSISASASPPLDGTVTGGGTVACGSSVTVCATATPCTSFLNWMENGKVVSLANCYSFTVFSNRTLVANFSPATPVPFVSSTYSVGNAPWGVTAADVKGDGKVDLICANSEDDTLTVLTNNGSGGFVVASTLSVGTSPYPVTAADVNGDGKVDLICANWDDGTLTVLTNNGSGGFVLASTLAVGGEPASVIAADVNGDGKVDLISLDVDGGTLWVLTNNGSGGFVVASVLTVGNSPVSVTAADVNGDGKVDLICANYSYTNTLTVLTNNGSGGFVIASTLTAGRFPAFVTAADVNGDGKPDLICANGGMTPGGGGYVTNTLTVLTNSGSGGFVVASTLTVGKSPSCVTAADVNGDGKPDLISANSNDGTLTVLTNNGSGIFVPNATLTVVGWPGCVIAADVNGDGKLDLISANFVGTTLTVLTQTTLGPAPPVITNQPAPARQTVTNGDTAAFTLVAGSGQPMGYTWYSIIGGVTNAVGSGVTVGPTNTLTLTNVRTNQAGAYFVTIVNSCSVTNSALATLVVTNPPRASTISSTSWLPGGGFQLGFTNVPGAPFSVVAATNVALPLSNWMLLTGLTEVTPGQFQFTDPQATNLPQRFYRVRSP
jgi:hypothetical protein